MFKTKRSVPLLVLIAISVMLSACVVPPSNSLTTPPVSTSQEPVTLDMNLVQDPSLDFINIMPESPTALDPLMLGLTELDPETQEPKAALATSWETNTDGITWTFSLRDDVSWVRFADGEVVQLIDEDGHVRMVNAHDVVYGIKRTCDARTGAEKAHYIYIIMGCEEASKAEEVTEELMDAIGVVALDDYTVEFTLNHAASYFSQLTNLIPARPQPQWAIESEGDQWTMPGVMPNNGPFVLAERIVGERIQLVKNPFWYGWNEQAEIAGNIEKINMFIITDQLDALAMYDNNELDFSYVDLTIKEHVEMGDSADELTAVTRNCTASFFFIPQREAVSDVRIRQALSMAVDRSVGGTPANTFTSPQNYGSPAGDPEIAPWALPEEAGGTGYSAALEMAQALMADAGYPEGTGLTITVAYNTLDASLIEGIPAMWKEAFPNIELITDIRDFNTYYDWVLDTTQPLEERADLFYTYWCANYPHTNYWIHDTMNPLAGRNYANLSEDDPQVGAVIAEFTETTFAALSASPEDQPALYKQAEKLFIEDIAAIIPLYYPTSDWVVKPWLDWVTPQKLYIYRWVIDAETKP